MDYTFIIIGFFGGAILVFIISRFILKKEKVFGDKTARINSLSSNDEILPKVKALLQSGKKIEAIKLVVKHKNIGLAEGKKLVDIVENHKANDNVVFQNIETQKNISVEDPNLLNQIRKLLADGKKIQAIKLVVTNRKMGLKEAKDFVETLERSYKL